MITGEEHHARAVVRNSDLGAWFPGIIWEFVDHNYPECLGNSTPGLVVVTPSCPPSRDGLHFVVTVPVPWVAQRTRVAIVAPEVVDAWRRGHCVSWTWQAQQVLSPTEVGAWLQRQRQLREAA